MREHKCPNCKEKTEIVLIENRRWCKKCGWYGDIVGGKTRYTNPCQEVKE